MATKKNTYKPTAKDGDGDGIVQDGTEFERPADCADCTDCESCEPQAENTPSEALEAPSEATKSAGKVKTYTAKDGDSYALIAELYPVAGMTKHERAMQLWRDHGGVRLKDGVEVKL